ncbi:3'-5' exonuclease [Streptomyces sp. SM12]|uniref:3'-5' exonuclease n=1 Tax=Streptomyces sp. SM12 TaxID=1071602 RepID=UPI000CD57E76|nr:3'-5' exonuclease [Streptomyces sp. SM12]
MARARDYGPIQLGRALDLADWQIERGRAQGLVPPGEAGGRWTQEQADALAERREEIVAVLGDHPGYGASRAADMLTAALAAAEDGGGEEEVEVWPVDVTVLAARDQIPAVGQFKGHQLYDARPLRDPSPQLLDAVLAVIAERAAWRARSLHTTAAARRCGWNEHEFVSAAAAAGIRAATDGRWDLTDVERLAGDEDADETVREQRLLTADQAADHMEIRRVDLAHAITAGWLAPHTTTEVRVGERRTVDVPLYLSSAVDALRHQPGVDWEEVRAARPGQRSPLLQHVGAGRTRAHEVRAFAAELERATGAEVWSRYRAASDRWLLDWTPGPSGGPTADEAADLLAAHPAAVHARSITLLTRSGTAVHRAAQLLAPGCALVVDTETTSLDGAVIELAVVDPATGERLVDTLIRPPDGVRITPGAEAVHGITNGQVADAPTLDKVWHQLRDLADGRVLLAYNADFDRGRLLSHAQHLGLPTRGLGPWECLMELRANWHGTTTWDRLGTTYHRRADGPPHRAAADAHAAARLLADLATRPTWWPAAPHA